jgi:hypothetical protein
LGFLFFEQKEFNAPSGILKAFKGPSRETKFFNLAPSFGKQEVLYPITGVMKAHESRSVSEDRSTDP